MFESTNTVFTNEPPRNIVLGRHELRDLVNHLRRIDDHRLGANDLGTESFEIDALENRQVQALGIDRQKGRRPFEVLMHNFVNIKQRHLDHLLDRDPAVRLGNQLVRLFLGKRVERVKVHEIIVGLLGCGHTDTHSQGRVLRPHFAQLLAKVHIRFYQDAAVPVLVKEVRVTQLDRVVRPNVEIGYWRKAEQLNDEVDTQVFTRLRE